ncbi:hypothetical protein [Mycolicibacterium sp. 050158]|uniref:hypothetical protein n=1 Tax=Mycolicibacterium sp. 050158 TaxID=3090602 RepID=UPI00299F481B|nr:hypothetical protein [Mycolicibacterium sp. 050158]MDX1888706.1 hypothetical protein [Mycolicibacterium sp. 050158]
MSRPRGTRQRRRLLAYSAPVAILLVLVLVKFCSVGIAGNAAVTDFANGDVDGLRTDVTVLEVADVVAPQTTAFAAGALAVLEDRLADADDRFATALAQTEPARSCGVRVNLELVRETLGDRAVASLDGRAALDAYRRAADVIDQAPPGCFTGSTDPDEQRRAVLDGAEARLRAKIDALAVPPPPPPPPPPAAAAAPAIPPPAGAGARDDVPLRLDPGGDPLERLQQVLRDAAAAQAKR